MPLFRFSLLIAVQLLVGGCAQNFHAAQSAPGSTAPSAVSQRCVAAVVVPGPKDPRFDDPIMISVGTAFAIENQYGFMATNAHVVRAAGRSSPKASPKDLFVRLQYPTRWIKSKTLPSFFRKLPLQGGVISIGAKVLAIDDFNDVALLRLLDDKGLDEACKPQFSDTLPGPGTVVNYTGYPLFSEVPMTLWARVATESITISRAEIAQLLNQGRLRPDTYLSSRIMLDAPIQGGASGSPVRSSSNGAIVGIASGSLLAPVVGANNMGTHAFGYVIPLNGLIKMMKENKVPYAGLVGQ